MILLSTQSQPLLHGCVFLPPQPCCLACRIPVRQRGVEPVPPLMVVRSPDHPTTNNASPASHDFQFMQPLSDHHMSFHSFQALPDSTVLLSSGGAPIQRFYFLLHCPPHPHLDFVSSLLTQCTFITQVSIILFMS